MNWDTVKNFITGTVPNAIKNAFNSVQKATTANYNVQPSGASTSSNPSDIVSMFSSPSSVTASSSPMTKTATPAYKPPSVKVGDTSMAAALPTTSTPTGSGSGTGSGTANGPQSFIPMGPNDPMPQGFTKTTTPQGGTAWQDPNGNIYTQNGGGLQLQTNLPGQQGQTTSYSTPAGPVSPSYVAGAVNGSSGQSSTDITATNGYSAQNPGTVPVGPGSTGTSPTVNPSAPSFSAGGVGNPVDLGAMNTVSSGLQTLSSGIADGSIPTTSVPEFISNLQNTIQSETASATATNGTSPGTTYNADPSVVANGDPNILAAINNDPNGFNALNQQFGVPQLQNQYIQSLNMTNGITAAVSKLSNDILTNNDIPQWLATRQISFLAQKANEIMTPLTAQASTIKAQLTYATDNMRTYYSNYWRGQTLSLSQQRFGLTQFNAALAANAINPSDTNAINTWATQLGMDPTQIQSMVTFKSALNDANLGTKQSTAQANEVMTQLLTNPNTIPSLLAGVQNGIISPTDIQGMSRTAAGAALRGLFVTAAANNGVNLVGAEANYAASQSAAKTANSAGVQLPITYIKSVIPNMQQLKTDSNAINRTDFPAVNSAEFAALLNTGDTNTVKYLTTVTEVADQVAKILQGGGSGGGTSDAKLTQAQGLFDKGFSKDQLNAVIDSLTPLLQSRASALENMTPNYTGGNVGAGSTSAGSGSTTPAPDATFSSLQNMGFSL